MSRINISVPFVWAFLWVRPATLIQLVYIASSTAYIDPATCAPSGLPGWSSCLSAIAAYTCPSGGTLAGDQCVTTTVTGTAPTCTGGTLGTTAGLCWTTAPAPCPGGTALDPLSGTCQAAPACGAGSYDPAKGSCFMGNTTCPSGNQALCMEYQGRMQCSPNPCFDPAAPGNQQTTTQNDAMLQNDGPKDAAGNCLGQLYIFRGKPSRCRPPGLRVGMINNCCDSDETVSEDLGTSIQTVANTIQTAYEQSEHPEPVSGATEMTRRLLITGLVLMLWTTAVLARNPGEVGRTWPIAEKDALTEIEAKARQVEWRKVLERKKVEAYQGPPDRGSLPRPKRDRTFPVDLTYTTSIDVPDGKGGILYPRGYTFNPLDYVTYPKTLVVINGNDPEQVQWLAASEYAPRLDVMLLLTEGSYRSLAKRVSRPVFYADRKIINRLHLQAVPSIIRQKGRFMEVSEIDIRRTATKTGAGAPGR